MFCVQDLDFLLDEAELVANGNRSANHRQFDENGRNCSKNGRNCSKNGTEKKGNPTDNVRNVELKKKKKIILIFF